MSELEAAFDSALTEHLQRESEGSLVRAYDLGREALAHGFGILDVFSLYEAAQRELVLGAPAHEQQRRAQAVANFFRELLSPFEMSFRGYGEANAGLKRLNADLTRAYAELQARQAQLVQSAKMASLGELVAGIAHEINNPLAFVSSHLGTARLSLARLEGELVASVASSVRERWDRIRNRLEESELGLARIRDLVLRLRTFSRLDEGERKQVSMRESVAAVLLILSHRYKDHIQVKTSFGEPDSIDCYPGLLNQAIMNLVSNAIDAIGESGTISIATGAQGREYVITVTDDGHGIPEAVRERIFEPFFTTKPVGKGTGLGLSITYSIVKQHGGTLELRPAETGGTLAIIRFPLRDSD